MDEQDKKGAEEAMEQENRRDTVNPGFTRHSTADPMKDPVKPASAFSRQATVNPATAASDDSAAEFTRRATVNPAAAAQKQPSAATEQSSGRPGDAPAMTQPRKDNTKTLLWVIVALIAVILGLAAWFVTAHMSQEAKIREAQALQAQAELDASQRDLQQAYDDLNSEFSQFENQRQMILDDSVKRELTVKYENARMQVEKLQQELRNQRNLSAAEIQRLKGEIETLRNLLRHYVEEINRLNIENENLRTENAEMRDRNEQLSTRVAETSRENEQLSERMTLAEKLNVTGVNLIALNKKGKQEKKVEKARQLRVTFTIPQNNSTPVGAKTIYLRIVSPTGQVLGGGGHFTFEGASLECTAKTVVEYTGEELGGVTIYWDVNTALSPGTYTVELFADNFRLCSRGFELK